MTPGLIALLFAIVAVTALVGLLSPLVRPSKGGEKRSGCFPAFLGFTLALCLVGLLVVALVTNTWQ